MIKLIGGIILSFLISYTALLKKSLSKTGFISAMIIGTGIFYFGTPTLFITLILFFISSSLLSKFREQEKFNIIENIEKGSQRDHWQVLANGGVPFILALLAYFYPDWRETFIIAYLGAISAVTADTWATEIGVLSKKNPHSIIFPFETVEKGMSGGISLLGYFATFLAGLFISLSGSFILILEKNSDFIMLKLIVSILLSGILASTVDSLFGALFQAQYYCNKCHKHTEKKIHSCGNKTTLLKGYPLFNNDLVNFITSISGAFFSLLIYFLI